MKIRKIIVLLTLIFACNVYGQQNIFHKADSIALYVTENVKSYQLKKITKELINSLESTKLKYRAIFKWVTLNISYDNKRLNMGSSSRYNQKRLLMTKKGLCGDYSNLLFDMCTIADIESKVISGYAKDKEQNINKSKNKIPRHAWVSVKINDSWFLSDATWAASVYDEELDSTIKRIDESYFMMSPKIFINEHYPEDAHFQLLEKKVSYNKFKKLPRVGESLGKYYDFFVDFQNIKGSINNKIKFSLTKKIKDVKLYVLNDSEGKPIYVYPTIIKKSNSKYEYTFKMKGRYIEGSNILYFGKDEVLKFWNK